VDQIKGHVTGGRDDFADLTMNHRIAFPRLTPFFRFLLRLILLRPLRDNKSASFAHQYI
jgi:hypothetical protein